MGQMKCDRCGSTEFEEQDGFYVCKYCGTRYTPEGEEEGEEEREETARPDQAEESGEEMQAQSINAGKEERKNTENQTTYVVIRSPKSWLASLLLCIFLGMFGVHRFYTGKVGTGILWLFTGGFAGIGWLVDLAVIASGHFKDKQGRPIVRR